MIKLSQSHPVITNHLFFLSLSFHTHAVKRFLNDNCVLHLQEQRSGQTEAIELAYNQTAAWLSAQTPDQLQGWGWSREAEGDVPLHKEKTEREHGVSLLLFLPGSFSMQMNKAVSSSRKSPESAGLDWHCTTCGRPVRLPFCLKRAESSGCKL